MNGKTSDNNTLFIATKLLLFSVFLGTLAFGAVHQPLSLTLQIIYLSFFVYVLLKHYQAFSNFLRQNTIRSTLLLLLLPLVFISLQSLLLMTCNTSHPILGSQRCHPAFYRAWDGMVFYTSCVTFIAIISFVLEAVPQKVTSLLRFFWLISIVVVAIALSHWLSDNGKLFWVFAPEYVFSSKRARWPFVNSNHLGHFLLLLIFPLVALLRMQLHTFLKRLYSTPRFAEQSLLKILGRKQHLHALIQLLFGILLLAAMGMSIVGTLSRSTWIGTIIASATLLILRFFKRKQIPKMPTAPVAQSKPVRVRHRRRRGPTAPRTNGLLLLSRHFNLIISLLVAATFSFFLFSGQGIDSIEGRLEYGLEASKEDIRWTLYADSTAMFFQKPLFGHGFGTWDTLYPAYMSPKLADVTPEYLHSDPFQVLVELGVLGTLPFLLLFLYLSHRVFRSSVSGAAAVLIHGIYASIVGFLVASFFDFPFRIPAICYLVCLLLAVLAHLLHTKDSSLPEESND